MINNLLDVQVKYFLLFWYLPYFMMGDIDSWQKMGITMNGIKPMCKE